MLGSGRGAASIGLGDQIVRHRRCRNSCADRREHDGAAARPIAAPAKNALVDGPILRTLLWLAWPNVIALSAGTCVVIAETSYIGRLGVESLAAMALVFPFVILTMTMSGGAMGGGVASAIARALGAGDKDRAVALAAHALLIGGCFGLTFMLVMLIFGPALLRIARRPRQRAGAARSAMCRSSSAARCCRG